MISEKIKSSRVLRLVCVLVMVIPLLGNFPQGEPGTWAGEISYPDQSIGENSELDIPVLTSVDPDNPGFYTPSKGKWFIKHDQVDGWSNYSAIKFGGA